MRKKVKSEVDVLEIKGDRKKQRARIRIQRSNDIVDNILITQPKEGPYYLCERCGNVWVEGKEPKFIYIEDLVEKMTIKTKYRLEKQFFLKMPDCKIVRRSKEQINEKVLQNYIEIPYINKSNYIEKEDVYNLSNYEECIFAEKWCRKRGIPYAYRNVTHQMVKF